MSEGIHVGARISDITYKLTENEADLGDGGDEATFNLIVEQPEVIIEGIYTLYFSGMRLWRYNL